MANIELELHGLNCPDCAGKITHQVQALHGVRSAVINLMSERMSVEIDDAPDPRATAQHISRIVTSNEPQARAHIREEHHNHDGASSPEHGHDHAAAEGGDAHFRRELTKLGVGALLFALVLIFEFDPRLELALYVISYLIVGSNVLLHAGRSLLRGDVFNEFFLMSLATLGAFALGEYAEGVGVMLFYLVGETLQDRAVNHSRRSIGALLKIRPDYANLKRGDDLLRVDPEQVLIGDLIVVKPGEKVPLDGEIVEGETSVDASALTGESLPRDLKPGDAALSGYINQHGLITVKVTKRFGDSTVSKILELVQNASSRKAETEALITRFARYYTPVVVLTAAALAIFPPLLLPDQNFIEWIRRALVFLVISCPCALVISIPLGFFGGLGAASKLGILVKGGNFLEALYQVDTVVFDKTGTLTKGEFAVSEIKPAPGMTREDLLELAAYAEAHSSHPIAQSIQKAYGRKIETGRIEHYTDVAGHGVMASVDGRQVLAGKAGFLRQHGVSDSGETSGTMVHVAVDGTYAGAITIADQVKADAAKAVKELKRLGVHEVSMLTGDQHRISERIGAQLGLDRVYSELLPAEKVSRLEGIMAVKSSGAKNGKTAFVGDGVNDAPVLARADVGIAMGGLGSDAAIEAADVVIMTDEPAKVATAIKVARRTHTIVIQNIILALGIKAVFLALGALGMTSMWGAVFADTGVALLAVLNAMRALSTRGLSRG